MRLLRNRSRWLTMPSPAGHPPPAHRLPCVVKRRAITSTAVVARALITLVVIMCCACIAFPPAAGGWIGECQSAMAPGLRRCRSSSRNGGAAQVPAIGQALWVGGPLPGTTMVVTRPHFIRSSFVPTDYVLRGHRLALGPPRLRGSAHPRVDAGAALWVVVVDRQPFQEPPTPRTRCEMIHAASLLFD